MTHQSMIGDHVTLVEVLELTGSFAEFATVSQAIAQRLEAEGIAELVAVRFYAAANATEIGGLLTFSDYRRLGDHIAMITAWDEFKQLLRVARLIDMRVYGPLSAEGEAFLHMMDGSRKQFETPVAGFVRWAADEVPSYRAECAIASHTHDQE